MNAARKAALVNKFFRTPERGFAPRFDQFLFIREHTLMIFLAREEPFICEHCGKSVEPLGKGTYRNHCPFCLWGKHVDDKGPGDRASLCQGLLEPIGIDQESKKGFLLEFRCQRCGMIARNRAAPDDDLLSYAHSSTGNV